MPEEYRDCSAIEIRNLTKSYGAKTALDNISFSVKRGEIMGFLGPNGAGKSTAMNIITGYLAPSSGKVLVEGIDTQENPMQTKRRIGYLPEIPPLYTDMTVLEYLFFVFDLKGVKADKHAHLRKVMEKIHIYDVRNRMIRNLSKGYKQRIGLAQALIGDPEVLILDEPTVGLDPRQIMEIRDVISELGRERTVVLSTHILQEVMAVCDSYTIINRGKIVACGSMSEFTGVGSDCYRLRVKGGEENALAVLKGIENLADIYSAGSFERGTTDLILTAEAGCDIRERIFNRFAERECPILSFSASVRSLEEVFMQAISNDTAAERESEYFAEQDIEQSAEEPDKNSDEEAEN